MKRTLSVKVGFKRTFLRKTKCNSKYHFFMKSTDSDLIPFPPKAIFSENCWYVSISQPDLVSQFSFS